MMDVDLKTLACQLAECPTIPGVSCRLPTHVASLTVMGDRIYVADSQESVFYMKYKKAENQLYIYADDTSSRYLTTQLQLDYDTLCGADKFGNIFMMRLPSDLSQQVSLHVLQLSYCFTCWLAVFTEAWDLVIRKCLQSMSALPCHA